MLLRMTEGSIVNYEKALAAIGQKLQPGESIQMKQKINYRNAKKSLLGGALALTPQRLIFVGSVMLDRAEFSIPLNTITSVDSHRSFANMYTTITAASATHTFLALDPKFVEAINKARMASAAPAPTAPTAASTADELSKLASLHASGVLTDEEFAAAKKRLLT